jgi:hypothetical protein
MYSYVCDWSAGPALHYSGILTRLVDHNDVACLHVLHPSTTMVPEAAMAGCSSTGVVSVVSFTVTIPELMQLRRTVRATFHENAPPYLLELPGG